MHTIYRDPQTNNCIIAIKDDQFYKTENGTHYCIILKKDKNLYHIDEQDKNSLVSYLYHLQGKSI